MNLLDKRSIRHSVPALYDSCYIFALDRYLN